MLWKMAIFHSFYIPCVCVHTTSLFHSSVYWHLGASMPRLLWMVLLCTLGSMHLFNLEFSSFLDICPGVGLLDNVLALCLELFSRVSAQFCPTLCDPRNWSPSDCSVHGILQAGILEPVSMPSSRGSSPPRDWTEPVSPVSPALAGRFLYRWATWGAQLVFQGTSRLFSIVAAPIPCTFLIFLPFYIQGLCTEASPVCQGGIRWEGEGKRSVGKTAQRVKAPTLSASLSSAHNFIF